MHAYQTLPLNYIEQVSINLQKNKKTAIIVNVLAVSIMLVLYIPAMIIKPLFTIIDFDMANGTFFIKAIVTAVSYVLYIIAHEFTHGFTMKHFGGKTVKYGFTGIYAFAGSTEDYFDKYAYLRITLAPAVVWGVVFLVFALLFPSWFWVFYLLQMGNLAGAAGDFYVTWLVSKLDNNILVRDTGVEMTIYGPVEKRII